MATGHQLQQAYLLIQNGRRQEAANLLTVLLASDPDNADALWLLAQAALDPNVVRRALTRLMELRPNDSRARQMLDSLGVREMRAAVKTATGELRALPKTGPLPAPPAAPLHQTATYPAVAFPSAAQLEPARPELKRRARNRKITIRREERNLIMRIALVGGVLFGLVGCGILAYALAIGVSSGIQRVEAAVTEAVGGFNPSITLPFISIETSGSQPEQPEMGNVNALGSLSYYQFRTGAIASDADQHAYTFTGTAGDFVLIELSAINGSGLNPAVALYGPDRALVGSNSDIAPENRNARLSLNLPGDGEFTIVVSSEGGAGAYQVTLRH